jgi:hypothetical protein
VRIDGATVRIPGGKIKHLTVPGLSQSHSESNRLASALISSAHASETLQRLPFNIHTWLTDVSSHVPVATALDTHTHSSQRSTSAPSDGTHERFPNNPLAHHESYLTCTSTCSRPTVILRRWLCGTAAMQRRRTSNAINQFQPKFSRLLRWYRRERGAESRFAKVGLLCESVGMKLIQK